MKIFLTGTHYLLAILKNTRIGYTLLELTKVSIKIIQKIIRFLYLEKNQVDKSFFRLFLGVDIT